MPRMTKEEREIWKAERKEAAKNRPPAPPLTEEQLAEREARRAEREVWKAERKAKKDKK